MEQQIANAALKYVGKLETKGNSGFQDPVFQREMQAAGWLKGYAWCSYFAEVVWNAVYANVPEKAKSIATIFSGSAVETYRRFAAAGYVVSPTPAIGSLAVWRLGNGWQGHIGIVVFVNRDGSFDAVEGNGSAAGSREGTMVVRKKRKMGLPFQPKGLNLIGFVRPI